MKLAPLAGALIALLAVSSPAVAQAPSLGTAADFSVLGGSTVTNTGSSTITGELGVSPGSAVTGFPPGTVTGGTIHSNDAVAIQAQSDSNDAWVALAALPCNTDLTGQDLGGLTLTSGVYCFDSTAQLTGTLTLDAEGDPDAEFIFQIGSALTTASASIVNVINGGSNCSVYWQIGSSATLGTTTQFLGNVLALASITLNNGANVSGRLLAQTGAVTLDANDAAVCPACEPILLAPATLPNGAIGVAYNQTITASGGTAPYLFALVAGSLPAGLTLSSAGAITGTPSAAGSSTFTVRAVDDEGCWGTRIYTIVINAPSCPVITVSPTTLTAATAGTPFSQMLTATGGTSYTFTVTAGALPTGLLLSPAGLLSGTPTSTGEYAFTVTATDISGCLGSQIYTGAVACPTITIVTTTLPVWHAGTSESVQIVASGGTAPYTFTVSSGTLPPGVTLSAGGILSGTPLSVASYAFTITATDSAGCPGARAFALTVDPPAPGIDALDPAALTILVLLLAIAGAFLLSRFSA